MPLISRVQSVSAQRLDGLLFERVALACPRLFVFSMRRQLVRVRPSPVRSRL